MTVIKAVIVTAFMAAFFKQLYSHDIAQSLKGLFICRVAMFSALL